MTRRDLVNAYIKDKHYSKVYDYRFEPMLEKLSSSDHAFALSTLVRQYKDWTSDEFRYVRKLKGRPPKATSMSYSRMNCIGGKSEVLGLLDSFKDYFENLEIFEGGKYWKRLIEAGEERMKEVLSKRSAGYPRRKRKMIDDSEKQWGGMKSLGAKLKSA